LTADVTVAVTGTERVEDETRGGRRPSPALLARRAAAFAAGAAIPTYLALRGGGYDLIARQEVWLAVWWLIALGYAVGFFPRGRPSAAAVIPLAGIGALAALTALSLTWTESSGRTFAELARVVGYGGLVVLALSALNQYTWRAAAAGVSVSALAIAGFATASRLFPGQLPTDTVAQALDVDRLSYPLNYWNGVGAWGSMAVAIGLAWSVHARSAIARCLALAAVPVAGLSVYLTYSRAGAIGAAVAIVAVMVLSRNRWTAAIHAIAAAAGTGVGILAVRGQPEIADATGGGGGGRVAALLALAAVICAGVAWLTTVAETDRIRLPPRAARAAIPALIVALLAGIVAGSASGGPIDRYWNQFQNQRTVSVGSDPAARLTTAGGSRHDIWSSALDAFRAHRWDGTGPGTFEFWWSRDQKNPEYVHDAHSIYLESLAELGYPGFLAILLFLGGALGAALYVGRRRVEHRSDVAASVALTSAFVVFVVQAGVDWMWELTAVGALALAAISIAIAGGSRLRPRIPLWLRATIVVAAVGLAIVEVPGLVSAQKIGDSEDALASGNAARARSLAGQAIDAEPWNADAREQRALVDEAQGDLAAAARDVHAAIDREPTNANLDLVLARIEGERGRLKPVLQALREAKRLAPKSPLIDVYYFRYAVSSGAPEGG
jgi:hypothetical protein